MDPAEIWRSLPVITRGYVSLCVITTAACALEVRSGAPRAGKLLRASLIMGCKAYTDAPVAALPPPPPKPCTARPLPLMCACHCRLTAAVPQIITPFNIYFNAKLIWQQHEYWRLFTNFFYFGSLGGSPRGSCRFSLDLCLPARAPWHPLLC